MKKILYIIEDFKLPFLFILIFSLVLNGFISLANPLALKYIFDEGIIKHNFKLFLLLSLGFMLIFTFWRLGNQLYSLSLQKLKNKVIESLVIKMLKSYYHKPYEEILNKESGYFVARIYDEAYGTADSLIDEIIEMANLIIISIITTGLLIYLSWRATFILVIVTPVLYYLSNRFLLKIKEQTKQSNEEEANLRGILARSIEAYKTVKIFEMYDKVYENVSQQLKKFLSILYSRLKGGITLSTLGQAFLSYIEVLVIIIGGYEILAGRMSFGGFMAFMNAFWGAVNSIREFINKTINMGTIFASVERLMEFSKAPVDISTPICDDGSSELKLVNIRYSYPGNSSEVLKGINLQIEKGEKILIIGPNGSGKSTIAHLIAGFLKPSAGELKTPMISRISAGLFPLSFIPGTVSDNVKLEILSEGKKRRFKEFLKKFGLDEKIINVDPQNLSAGQKKKVEIIMTLLKDADVYIFDEPLANIDKDTKDKIIETIFEETKGKTLIIIMHDGERYLNLFDKVYHVIQK